MLRRTLVLVGLALFVSCAPAAAFDPGSGANCGFYINKDGRQVPRPCGNWHTQQRPPAASARCRDGTYSFSLHTRGTCSHHGGVAGR